MRKELDILKWEETINVPVEKLWHIMLDDQSYREWTVAFNPGGSWYEKDNAGDFVAGENIKFLGPDSSGQTGGMISKVNEVRKYEFISFHHLGFIMNGVEDTESEKVKAWSPSFENYTFTKIDENTTLLKVEMESDPEYTEMFNSLWPKAMLKLKEISEK
jgi:uncharacterized protein YndB with AHSA1/START domain